MILIQQDNIDRSAQNRSNAKRTDVVGGLRAAVGGSDDMNKDDKTVNASKQEKKNRKDTTNINCIPTPNQTTRKAPDWENHEYRPKSRFVHFGSRLFSLVERFQVWLDQRCVNHALQ